MRLQPTWPALAVGPAAGAKGGRAYIQRAVTESLRRLRTDYIDLYQLHVPDPVTPVEETLAALNELVVEGNAAAAEWTPTAAELAEIDAIVPPAGAP